MQAEEMRVLLSREQIAARVAELAKQISTDFVGEPLLLVGVLKGAATFLKDLAGRLTVLVETDFVRISSYGEGTASNRQPKLEQDLTSSIAEHNVLVVEDILDTGFTLNFLTRLLRERNPLRLKVAALLDKPSRRVVPFTADYVGFTIADEFIVGYGMDFHEQYRDLADIRILPAAPVAKK